MMWMWDRPSNSMEYSRAQAALQDDLADLCLFFGESSAIRLNHI
jgi:hypothetical protein